MTTVQHLRRSKLVTLRSRAETVSVLQIAQGVTAAWWIAIQVLGLQASIYAAHSHRQTQTAWSVRTILRGAGLVRYETPILGAPFSIPMEFPLYQWIVAALVRLTGLPIVTSGRLVSGLAFLCVVAIIRAIQSTLSRSDTERSITTALLFASPIYGFWSHTVLIETTALAVCLLALLLALRWHRRESVTAFVGAIVAGGIGGATKITTAAAIVLAAGLLFGRQLLRDSTRHRMAAGLLAAVPLLAGQGWAIWADGVKRSNPMGEVLTSSGQRGQLFGSLAERTATNQARLLLRLLDHGLGSALIVVVVAVLLTRVARRERFQALTCLLLPVIVSQVLFHVYLFHDYYAVAVSVSFTAGLAALLGHARVRTRTRDTLVLLVVVASMATYLAEYFTLDRASVAPNAALVAAIQNATSASDTIIIRGTDWNPELSWAADRRAIVHPGLDTTDEVAQVRETAQKANAPITLLVQCGSRERESLHLLADTLGFVKRATLKHCELWAKPASVG